MKGLFKNSLLLAFVPNALIIKVNGLPSYGTKIPNGEEVPCPPSSTDCSLSGYCAGLGHLSCGGFQPEDKVTDANGSFINLSPFGHDWKEQGFMWTKELCELDSDGDGFTNGQELGDPLCVWTMQDGLPPQLNAYEGFVPSHPGDKDSIPPVIIEIDVEEGEDEVNVTEDLDDESDDPYASYFNPGETRGSFELITKPYPIPKETTTYVDFVFDIPEDVPDLVHIVFGETIVSQPDHLHHFVLFGCTQPIEEGKDGTPVASTPRDCTTQLGLWAPGAEVFGMLDLESGTVFGRSMGFKALSLNVHYTDGVYEDEENKTLKIATDGIRVHYTTDFRPYSSMRKELIWVPFGPPEMNVPPNESRYFVSKTCNVRTACKDASDQQLQFVTRMLNIGDSDAIPSGFLDTLSCATLGPFCYLGGEFGPMIQRVCPVTCGLCDQDIEGGNPRNPESYRVTSIAYHAHLLGSEMYATLLKTSEEDQNEANFKAGITAKDLKSRDYYNYNDQSSIPMDFDIVVNDDADAKMMRGVQVKDGDKIQVSCVYDSTSRTTSTDFGLSTYEEMCIIAVQVIFETPASILTPEAGASIGTVDTVADLNLRIFSCEVDNEQHTSDVYQGFLDATDDGKDIWFKHPLEKTEMCTFPIGDYLLVDNFLTNEARNCPGQEQGEMGDICKNFLEDVVAGYTCVGGNPGFESTLESPLLDEETCLSEGGGSVFSPFSCGDIQFWLDSSEADALSDQEKMFVRLAVTPVCCGDSDEVNSEQTDNTAGELDEICDAVHVYDGDAIAGYNCEGAKVGFQNTLEAPELDEEICLNEGGGYSFVAYTCNELLAYLQSSEAMFLTDEIESYIVSASEPFCCKEATEDVEVDSTKDAENAQKLDMEKTKMGPEEHFVEELGAALSSSPIHACKNIWLLSVLMSLIYIVAV